MRIYDSDITRLDERAEEIEAELADEASLDADEIEALMVELEQIDSQLAGISRAIDE